MKKKLLFLFSMMALLFAPFSLSAQTDDEYNAALAAITDGGTYRVFTDIGGTNYYLNSSGKLVSNVKKASTFTFTAVKAEGTLYETGWNLGCKFTNPSLDGGSTGNVVQKGGINVGSNDRNDWERQVFFKNAEGKYAIRSTNANSANWGANTYWDAVTYEELPAAGYSLEASFVWQIEENVDNRPAAWNKTQTWAPILQALGGLATKGEQFTSNAKESSEGSYDALVDGEYTTYFHSTWSGSADADHYLQAELPEAVKDFYIYFKKRSQNNNNRPTDIIVSGSNDGESFTQITEINEGLPTGSTPIDYISAKISGAEAYKYLRFTIIDTNNHAVDKSAEGHKFFTFSEFYILPSNALTDAAAPLMVADYTDLEDEDVAKIDAFDAKLTELVQYAAALDEIKDGGNYCITTDVDGTKYYLTADGKLTSEAGEAGTFTLNKVTKDSGLQFEFGFLVNSQNDTRFSNPYNTSIEWLTNGSLNSTTNNRTDWEAQVFFLKDGKFAVRSTNAPYSGETSGWNWIGNTYWTVNAGAEGPLAEYSFDKQFIWTLEDNSLVDVTYNLVINGEVVATESISSPEGFVPTAPSSFNDQMHGLYSLTPDVTEITSTTTVVNFTPVWKGLFKFSESFDNATWYNMTIRGDWQVFKCESEPYTMINNPTLDNLASPEFKWAIASVAGEAFQVLIYNAAAGAGQTLTNDGGNVVMRDGEFKWEIFANSDGFVLRPAEGEGRDNMWVNQSGGAGVDKPLQFWNSTSGKTDNGSTFRVKEAPGIYAVTCAEAENGSVEADRAQAPVGATVTLTITPEKGYVVDAIVVKAGEEAIEVSKKNTFEMPASDVTVTVTFTDAPDIYIETDLTAQFPLDWQGWTGATGFVGWAAPAVTTNDGRETPACEKYESTCEPTGNVFTRTLTGLANGIYNIELYGAAAYTSGRGFESELVEGDETAVYLFAETPAGKVQQFIPAHVADNFNSTGIATAMLENVVVTDGTITIGMAKEKGLTNWHVVQIKGVTAKVKAAEVLATTVARAKAVDTSVLSSALAGKLAQAVEDNDGVYYTAEDYIAAINAIEAVIAEADIYVVAAPKLEQMKKFVDATNFYTAEAKATYYDTPKQKLDEGTLTMGEANALQDPYVITGWRADVAVDDLLCSVWDVEPADWNNLHVNTWSNEGVNDGSEFKVPFFEYWTGDDNSLAEKTMTATFEGLEAGKTALVNIWVRVRAKNGTTAADATGITLQVNDGEAVDVTEGEAVGQFNLAKYAALGVVGEDGKLEVKFIVAAENNISWLSFQNAQYSYVDPELVDYATALYNIEDGANYNITTKVGEDTYYLTADGKLTADADAAGIFGFQKVEGVQYDYGFLLTSQNGTRFSNPANTEEAALTKGALNTSTNNRSDWEAQVFFLNEEGKFAVRATNAGYNGETSGWAWIGNTYWAVHEGPLAEYGWEKSYDWELEKVNTVKVTYALYDAGSEEPVKSVVVTQKINSEVVIPTTYTSVAFYDYVAEGTIGTEDCTIKVTRTYKAGLIFNLEDLSNTKAYTIACDRGALLTKDGFLASTMHSSLTSAAASNFAIINYMDNYYLYSVADGKFVTNSGELSDIATNGIEDAIKIDPKTAPYFMYYFTIGGTDCGLNTNGDDPYGYVINTWMTADAGNQYYMIEAADFDPTAALALLEKGAYLVPLREALAANEPNPVLAGAGLFQKPQGAYDTYKQIYDAQKLVAENEASTIAELIDAKAALDGAIADYAAVEVNKPIAGELYMFQHKSSGGYMGFNEAGNLFVLDDPDAFTWSEVEGGYNLNNGAFFIAVDGSTLLGNAEAGVLITATPVATTEDGQLFYNIFTTTTDGKVRAITGSTAGKKATLLTTPSEKSQWTIVPYEVKTTLDLAVDVVRPIYPNQYQDQYASIDVEAVKKFLGVETLTAENVSLSIINPDGTEITDYAGYDGWFGKDGSAQNWGDNAFICVKMFQALTDGQFFLCHMNGPTTEDQVSVKWAFKANGKTVIYTVNVTFEEYVEPSYKPEIIKTIDIAHTEMPETAYSEAEPAPKFDVAEVCNALGIADISEAKAYIVNVTTGNFVENSTDGWRNADGDAAPWGECTNGFCVKLDNPASGEFNYTGAHDANFKEGDTYLAQWGLVANEKAVLLKVNVTFSVSVGIRDMQLDGKAEIYDLNGRKVSKIQRGGIYIVNGKRVAVK